MVASAGSGRVKRQMGRSTPSPIEAWNARQKFVHGSAPSALWCIGSKPKK